MEVLLPSEIARLVLGYLEEQKCNEAARIFLETCPHLQECRAVICSGRRFSTKVSGMTLTDFIDKFVAISIMIQERMSKVADCEQSKHCGDLVEQLKFLVGETQAQRFFVNINVPSQANSQRTNGSPIVSSSMRKRHHSNSDREKCKRTKLSSNSSQQSESAYIQTFSSDNVDATLLENLPGHVRMPKELDIGVTIKEKRANNFTGEHQSSCSSGKGSLLDSNHSTHSAGKITNVAEDKGDHNEWNSEINNAMNCKQNDKTKKCTTATNTVELLTLSRVEVQTAPYDTLESESETNDEPIENLSLFTKELLNHTELQERIAENINKAILPTDTSLRDESLNDTIGGEANTSIMSELNNAIKSIVQATEADPAFERLLDDIIGPNIETNMSPVEDCDAKLMVHPVDESRKKQPEIIINISSSSESTVPDVRSTNETKLIDVPLKHRLRSSSRQQNARVEDETGKHLDQEKEKSALEDQNAVAIFSIINANIINSKSENDKRTLDDGVICIDGDNEKELPNLVPNINKHEEPVKSTLIDNQKVHQVGTIQSNNIENKVSKNMLKCPELAKPKPDSNSKSNECISEQEVTGVPTLILCSKEEVSSPLTTSTPCVTNRPISSTFNSRFIPIAPKDPTRIIEIPMEPLYVKTVNVAHKVLPLPVIPGNSSKDHPKKSQAVQKRNIKASDKTKDARGAASAQILNDMPIPCVTPENNKLVVGAESITLHSNEVTAKTLLDTRNIPTISLEENLSLSGTGLSPYLKFNCSKFNQNHSLSEIDLGLLPEITKVPMQPKINATTDQLPTTATTTDCDLITKRTPRTLLKSRSKNHRLSLSTPRRRSTHIRALDFNTPTKITASNRTRSDAENVRFSPRSVKRTKSGCRTSLFKSPPFSNNTVASHKTKSPLKLCHPSKLPIATRISAPKHTGALATGNPSHTEKQVCLPRVKKDTWDADLRRALQVEQENDRQKRKTRNRNKETRKAKNTTIAKKSKGCSTRTLKCKITEVPEGNTKNTVNAESAHFQKPAMPTFVENTENENRTKILEMEQTASKSLDQSVVNGSNNAKKGTIGEEITPITSHKCNVNSNTIEDKIAKMVVLPKENATSANTVIEKKSVKKYAQLKTLKTNLKKVNTKKEQDPGSNTVATDTTHTTELRKSPVNTANHVIQIPGIIDLGTPRKFENSCGLPSTPRVLSPSSSTASFLRISEDSGKVRSFICTPEFPPTPCIVVTPKHVEQTTIGSMKDSFNSSSSYYSPTSEKNSHITELAKLKSYSCFQKCPPTSSNITNRASVSAKLEITQFEVIKENLTKEEAVKELKILSNSRDLSCTMETKNNCAKVDIGEGRAINENSNGYQTTLNNERCVFSSDDSSDSDTSTSSDSSSSSSLSSSSSASSNSHTTNSPGEYNSNQKSKGISNKIYTETTNESVQKIVLVACATNNTVNLNAVPTQLEKETVTLINVESKAEVIIRPECESSPLKVFSITKTDEELRSTTKETPAKDETLLNEADISETPSSSKNGVETTNLSSKISALISSEGGQLSKESNLSRGGCANVIQPKQKPKIVSSVRLQSNVLIFPKTVMSDGQCIVGNVERPRSAGDKLAVELEEKRKRMMSKLRDIPKSNATRGKIQRRRVTTRGGYNSLSRNTHYKQRTANDGCSSYKTHLEKSYNNITEVINASTSCSSQIRGKKTPNAGEMQRVTTANKMAKNKTSEFEEKRLDTKNRYTLRIGVESVSKNIIGDNRVRIMEGEISAASEISSSNWAVEEKQETSAARKVIISTEIKHPVIDTTKKDDVPIERKTFAKKQLKKDSSVSDKTVHENLSDTMKKEHERQKEQKVCKTLELTNLRNASKSILNAKVDQVKRDLFSDEENETRITNQSKSSNNETNSNTDIQTSDIANAPMQTVDVEIIKDTSSVLECLQLFPACKNDQVSEDALESGNHINVSTSITFCKYKYNFVYDDNAPIRKRQRRYSDHELEILANAFNNDCDSFANLLTVTDLEEIFHVSPKSKNRLGIQKSLVKSGKNRGTTSTSSSKSSISGSFAMNDIHAKPLATTSSVDTPVVAKTKKAAVKNYATSGKNNSVQFDGKKRQSIKRKRSEETEKDNPARKAQKVKMSETEERKQVSNLFVLFSSENKKSE